MLFLRYDHFLYCKSSAFTYPYTIITVVVVVLVVVVVVVLIVLLRDVVYTCMSAFMQEVVVVVVVVVMMVVSSSSLKPTSITNCQLFQPVPYLTTIHPLPLPLFYDDDVHVMTFLRASFCLLASRICRPRFCSRQRKKRTMLFSSPFSKKMGRVPLPSS